jgi:serine protease Do
VVTQVREGGFFDNTDVPVGSIVTEINRQPISNVADIDHALNNLKNGMVTIGGYYPDGTRLRSSIQVQ